MRKYHLFLMLLLIYISNSFAQSVQSGMIKEYNERLEKTPLNHVEIMISNAASTASDEKGNFMLQFRTLKPGDKVNVRRIEKLGYEIFNKEALEQWFISRENKPFTIVMCKSDKFKRIRDNYSRVSSESYEKQLKSEEARLKEERKKGKIKEEEYLKALKKLNEDYDRQLDNLDNYVDRFARIDLSELSATEAEIIEYVQRGKIDKAIQLYEQQGLEEKYKQQISIRQKVTTAIDTLAIIQKRASVSRDSIFASIKRKNETLRLAGGKENYKKIEESLREVALADTTNTEAVWEYASFLYQQAKFYETIDFFQVIIRNCPDEWKKALAYTQIADAQRRLKRYDYCSHNIDKAYNLVKNMASSNPDAYQDQLAQVLTSKSLLLYETNQLVEAEKVMVDICDIYENLALDNLEGFVYKLSKAQNNLGNVYRKIRLFDNAEHYMKLSLQNVDKLYEKNPHKYLFDLASTRNNLGLIYKTMLKNDLAESCYLQAIDEMSQLMSYNPDAYREEYLKYLNNMGALLKSMKRYEEAEPYYIKILQVADTLYSSCPEAYAMYWGGSLLNLGNLYVKTKRYDDAKNNLLRALPIIRQLYQESPDAFRVHYFSVNLSLGNVCTYQEEYVEAEAYALESYRLGEQLIKMNPKAFAAEYFMVLKNLGILYMYLKNTEKAEYFYLLALQNAKFLYNEHPEVYENELISIKYLIGNFYKTKGDTEKAKQHFLDALGMCEQDEKQHQSNKNKIENALSEL